MTLTTQSPMANAGSGLSIAIVDGYATTGAAVSVGDVLPLPSANVGTATLASGLTTASAAQRKSAVVCVAMEAATASGQRIRVRLQGRCKALVKSTSASAIAVGDRLCFGTAKALDAQPSLVNTNRWVAYADEAYAVSTSVTAALKDVILMGPNGLGNQAVGT